MSRLVKFVLGCFAGLVQRVSINRVLLEVDSGTHWVRKRRTKFGWILICLGNPVLRCRRVPIQVLHRRQWLRWEQTVKRATRNEEVRISRDLVCQKIPGEPLATLLDLNLGCGTKCQLLTAAASALYEFHQVQVEIDGLGLCFLSHGDASISNVLIEIDSDLGTANRAEWIDFDLRHDLSMAAVKRFADDLRALLFTASGSFASNEVSPMVESIKVVYPDQEVWLELAEMVSHRLFEYDIFHRAQMRRAKPEGNHDPDQVVAASKNLQKAIRRPSSTFSDVNPN